MTSKTPSVLLLLVQPLPLSLATTHRISVDFSSSPYLDVSVQAVPLIQLFDSLYDAYASHMRIAPFGYLRINSCLLIPAAFRSLPRPSSAPNAKAFSLRSYQLNHLNYVLNFKLVFAENGILSIFLLAIIAVYKFYFVPITRFESFDSCRLIFLICIYLILIQFSSCKALLTLLSKFSANIANAIFVGTNL